MRASPPEEQRKPAPRGRVGKHPRATYRTIVASLYAAFLSFSLGRLLLYTGPFSLCFISTNFIRWLRSLLPLLLLFTVLYCGLPVLAFFLFSTLHGRRKLRETSCRPLATRQCPLFISENSLKSVAKRLKVVNSWVFAYHTGRGVNRYLPSSADQTSGVALDVISGSIWRACPNSAVPKPVSCPTATVRSVGTGTVSK